MLSFYLIWSLSYFTLLWWMSRFWSDRNDFPLTHSFSPLVTLVIPLRNEEENIPDLIVSLKKLQYPNLEILLIDDHSEDGSFQFLMKGVEGMANVKALHSLNPGKKNALECAVKLAAGEIILCSDADCRFPDFWVEKMILPFQDDSTQLVAGPVLVEGKGKFMEMFQVLDWASILLMTSYSFANKSPLMCSGANFAYRKEAFQSVKGYEGNREIASGDDEFLLKKIHKMFGEDACCYFCSPDTLVYTKPAASWKSMINQRIRWASKWRAHFSLSHAISAVGAFFVQLGWIGSFSLLFLGQKGVLTFGVVWLIKIIAERISLGKVLRTFGIELSNLSRIQTSFVHSFYVLCVGIGGLRGKFIWKGRGNWRSVNLESEI